jgi:hypothetical protein
MSELTVPIPDAWDARIIPAVVEQASGIEGHNIVQKILAHHGITSVDDLTIAQKASLLCLFYLWKLTAQYETKLASNSARQEALQGAIDDFEL